MFVQINSFKNQQGDPRYQLVLGYTSIVLDPVTLQSLSQKVFEYSPKDDLPTDK